MTSMVAKVLRQTVSISSKFNIVSSCRRSCYVIPNSRSVQLRDVYNSRMIATSCRNYAEKKIKSKDGKGKKKAPLLSDAEIAEVINKDELDHDMMSVVNSLKEQFLRELSVRTSPGVFEKLMVDTPDGRYPLNNIAQVVLKNPQLILINLVSSPQYVPDVKDSLLKSGLNVNPQIEGSTIFIPLPKVTKEHREKLAKSAKTLSDKSIEKLRNVQVKYQKIIKAEKNKHSEDLIKKLNDMVMVVMHEHRSEVEKLRDTKQKDLLSGK